MIEEALKFLASQAREAHAAVKVNESPARITFLAGDQVLHVDKPYPSRRHTVDSLDSLAELANRFAAEEPSVWVNSGAAVLVINDAEHRDDAAICGLPYSDVFGVIQHLAKNKPWLEQKPFIRMLRIELNGTLPPVALLERVRKLRFEQGAVVNSEVTRNRESMGRDIIAKIDAGGDLPEAVTLEVPVHKLGPKYSIACAVDTDPARGLLQLIPFPDEIERVVDLAVADVIEGLRAHLDEGVMLYHGAP